MWVANGKLLLFGGEFRLKGQPRIIMRPLTVSEVSQCPCSLQGYTDYDATV